ncbi:MAG: Ribosomal protein L7/L12 [Parcubacteria group bacterium GW2011_GWF1_39_37]|nr:MAG: Ribosomal protein L7/L12 [Parcubacteria group bacterium GW2011_GWF1_39_37]
MITAIFVAPPSVSSTLKDDFSSLAVDDAPPAGAAVATAAADTPNFSSRCFTSSCKSRTDIFSIASTTALNLAGVAVTVFASALASTFVSTTASAVFVVSSIIMLLNF